MARKLIILLWIACFALFLGASDAHALKPQNDPLKPPPEFVYIDLKPLVVPVIDDRGLTKQISVVVSLVVPYAKAEEVEAMMPRLTDAYIGDLYNLFGSGNAMMDGDIVDVGAVQAALTEKTGKILGPDMVKEVLLEVVQQAKR